ncbi:MAG: hypothetical protein EON93_02785 [Burkholderiales bacterium]|nr:MAG: hypothetical protein EON93_02785 [Burkholderiales bacterium]
MSDAHSSLSSAPLSQVDAGPASLSKAEAVSAYWYPQARREEWLADVIVHVVGIVLAIAGCSIARMC